MLELLFLALFVTLTTLAGGCAARVDGAADGDVRAATDPLRCNPDPFGRCIDPCAPLPPSCPSGRTLVLDADGIEDLCRCSSPFGSCYEPWTAPSCPATHPDLVIDYGADTCESVSTSCGPVSAGGGASES